MTSLVDMVDLADLAALAAALSVLAPLLGLLIVSAFAPRLVEREPPDKSEWGF